MCFIFQPDEAIMIQQMFNFYDFEATGRIRKHLAFNLLKSLGLCVPAENLPHILTLKDVFLFADGRCPDQTLEGALDTTFHLAAAPPKNDEEEAKITPESLVNFLYDLDRNPPTVQEAAALLGSMLPYDDCSLHPEVTQEDFSSSMIAHSKLFSQISS